jgi:hypothetical protein
MITNKKMFYTAIVLYVALLILSLPFPNEGYLGETIATNLNIPVRFESGLSYIGLSFFFILFASLFLLNNSIDKYNTRAILMAVLIAIFGPSSFVSLYQKTFATDIYAVSYDSDMSSCDFYMIDKITLHGECMLPFKNYSSNDVKFSIEFYEEYDDESQFVTVMNNNGPYEVELKGNQRKTEKIESNIDVSKLKNRITGGSAMGVKIVMKSGKKVRRL